MLLKKLLEPQRVEVEINDIKLYFKKLTWNELNEFQDFATKQDNEDNEGEAALILSEYILDKYVTDKEGDKVVDISDIKGLPVSFCVKLVEKFLEIVRGTEDIKKK